MTVRLDSPLRAGKGINMSDRLILTAIDKKAAFRGNRIDTREIGFASDTKELVIRFGDEYTFGGTGGGGNSFYNDEELRNIIAHKVNQDDFQQHIEDDVVHITEKERTYWNCKQEQLVAGSGVDITDNKISVTYKYDDTEIKGIINGIQNLTTSVIAEGNNLYYTDARVKAAITGTAPITVNNGVISHTDNSTIRHVSDTQITDWNAKQNTINTIALTGGVTGSTTNTSGTVSITTTLRALTSDDIPTLNVSKLTAGTLPVARGGTNKTAMTANRLLGANATADAYAEITVNTSSQQAGALSLSSGILSHVNTDGYKHVPATGTTNNGKFLKSGSTAGSEAWASLAISDVSDLQSTLNGKASSSHNHAVGDINNFTATATSTSPSTSDITNSLNSIINTIRGNIRWLDANKTNNSGTITGVTGGTGLSGSGTSGSVTINHSNSITAVTSYPTGNTVRDILYDAQGHITGTQTRTISGSGGITSLTSTAPVTIGGTAGGSGTGAIGVRDASATLSGIVSAGAQSFTGVKTFINSISSNTSSNPGLEITNSYAGSSTPNRLRFGAYSTGTGGGWIQGFAGGSTTHKIDINPAGGGVFLGGDVSTTGNIDTTNGKYIRASKGDEMLTMETVSNNAILRINSPAAGGSAILSASELMFSSRTDATWSNIISGQAMRFFYIASTNQLQLQKRGATGSFSTVATW